MRYKVAYGIVGFLLAAGGSVPLAGHADLVGPLTTVEGEARSQDAGQCAPDGEWMLVRSGNAFQGGAALEYPHDGCWAQWTVTLGNVLTGLVIGSSPPTGGGSGVRECAVWRVVLDGTISGATAAHCGENGVGQPAELPVTFSGPAGNLLPAGTHTIRVAVDFTLGPDWANAYVDYLGLSISTCTLPVNRAPTLPSITINGFDDGHYAWVGFDYTFRVLAVSDPDGDPIRSLTWTFGDGTTATGAQVIHRFAGAAVRDVGVTATDDPSARNVAGCPLIPALSTPSLPWRVTVTPDWTVTLQPAVTSLALGSPAESCVVVQQAPAPRTVAGRCVYGANVDVKSARADAVRGVDFRLETGLFGTATAAPYQAALRTLDHAAGTHAMTAAARASNDAHERVFTSAGYAFVNV